MLPNKNTVLNEGQAMRGPETLIEHVQSVRSCMIAWEEMVLDLKNHKVFSGERTEKENFGEAIANITIAYRHMEDARMRLGKVIQAMDGGVSVYDKK